MNRFSCQTKPTLVHTCFHDAQGVIRHKKSEPSPMGGSAIPFSLQPDSPTVPRAGNHEAKRQVFWLPDQTTIHAFPFRLEQWPAKPCEQFTGYSGGSATVLHRFPFYPTSVGYLFFTYNYVGFLPNVNRKIPKTKKALRFSSKSFIILKVCSGVRVCAARAPG